MVQPANKRLVTEAAVSTHVATAVTADGPAKTALNDTYAPVSGSTNYASVASVPLEVGARSFLGNSFAFKGDSITNYGEGYPYYAQMLSKSDIAARHVQSHSGFTSTAILGEFPALINADPKPTACVLLWGANDAQTSTPLATFKANTENAVAQLRAAGIAPVLCTVPPNNNDTYDGFVRLYNAWIMRYAGLNRIPLVDFYTTLVDQGTGNWKAAYDNGDGLHPSNAANKVMGQLVYDTLKPLLTPRPYVLQPTAGTPNIQTNSNHLTDANADGLADGYTATASTGFTWSRVDDPAGFKWQRITLDGTAVGVKQVLGVGIDTTGFTVGDKMRFAARVRNGQVGGKTILQITCYTAGFASVVQNFILTSTHANGMTQQIDGITVRDFTVPANTQIVKWSFQGEGAGTYDVAQPTWYNLTRLGI